jgi:DNA-binding transcriptional ArsR family regulator
MASDLDLVFKALADPTRRLLLDRLFTDNGQALGALCAQLAISRQAITKHLHVLEAANLVATARRGREKLHYLNPEPIEAIAERWIGKYERRRLQALRDIKLSLERDGDGEAHPDRVSRPHCVQHQDDRPHDAPRLHDEAPRLHDEAQFQDDASHDEEFDRE